MKNPFYKTFGLAISNTALTAVEISREKFGLKVVNHSRIELEAGIIEDDCIIVNNQAFQEALRKLLLNAENGPIKTKNVIISIPEDKTFTHRLCIPKEHNNDNEYIYAEAKDFIPITLNEAVVDYQIIKSKCTNKSTIYKFVATQKSIINSLIKTLKEVNLNVVGVDTNDDSLIRSCNNEYQKNKGDFMVIYINFERTTICICTTSGMIYHVNINIGGKDIEKHIMEALQLPTVKNAKELIAKFKKNKDSITTEQKSIIQKKLQDTHNLIIIKINELIKIIKNKEDVELKTTYLIGCSSGTPGFTETIQANYPKIEIKQKLNYIEINENTEIYYARAIGLALKDVTNISRENDINLLPDKKREEIETIKVIPKIKKYLIGISFLLGLLMIFFGIMVSKKYLEYRFSVRRLSILNEEAMNPYLNELSKTYQEKNQLNNAIINILNSAVPESQIMKSIDSYNSKEIELINANYSINAKNEIEMRLRAKTISRNATEKFIYELEQNSYFTEVQSPLSNLVGKGERFINIDLKLDPYAIINSYEEEKKQEEKEITKEFELENTEQSPRKRSNIADENEEEPAKSNEDENKEKEVK